MTCDEPPLASEPTVDPTTPHVAGNVAESQRALGLREKVLVAFAAISGIAYIHGYFLIHLCIPAKETGGLLSFSRCGETGGS